MTGSERPESTGDPEDPDPDNPRICYCMKIHREELVAAVAAGARTVEELRKTTTAGTGCGTCRSELLALLRELLPGAEVDSRIW
jgi:assimilatory nitrate reductase catalytic subunit